MPDVSPLLKTRSRPLAKRPGRIRCPKHLEYVASLPCVYPGCRAAASVHHLRVRGTDACAGRRSSDRFAVPVCQAHHQGQGGIHHFGDEEVWFMGIGIDPLALAADLWATSPVNGGEMP